MLRRAETREGEDDDEANSPGWGDESI